MRRARAISLAVVATLTGACFFFALMGMMARKVVSGEDPETGIAYELPKDDDEEAGSNHTVYVRLKPGRARVASARLLYRIGGEESFASLPMEELGSAGLHVAEIPAQAIATRVFFYIVVEAGAEKEGGPAGTFAIPPGAADGAFHLRFEGRTSPALMAVHVGLAAAAPIVLVHSLFFILAATIGRATRRGEARGLLRAAHLCAFAAWIVFFLGTIPVGILANEAKYGASFEGWPFGTDITDTKTEVVLVAWLAFLAWRRDLFKRRADPRPRADRAYPLAFVGAILIALVAFLIPHSFFFTG